ncbi:uncharacterized protein LOC128724361 [Anopheles nili]|uniref:uncharacterized protein LOC128724361 n=1 Tax=Anopheles nili TaxID=185578 RepID=UPI00237C04A2|nr:uncharacterized protein LOC128724361 [Anopheles nili]
MKDRESRPVALRVIPAEDASWEEVFRLARLNNSLTELRTEVVRTERTRRDHLILRLKQNADGPRMRDQVSKAIGSRGVTTIIAEMAFISANNVDPLATPEEVAAELKAQYGVAIPAETITLHAYPNGLQRVRARVLRSEAMLLDGKKLRLAIQHAREDRADVVLLSDPHRVPTNNGNWVADESGSVAIIATGRSPVQRVLATGVPWVTAAVIDGVLFICCYVRPLVNVERFVQVLEAVEMVAMGHQRIVLAGDFNASHEEWGSPRSSLKGEELLLTCERLGLKVLNRGNTPTFVGNGVASKSIVDVSFASHAPPRAPSTERRDRSRTITRWMITRFSPNIFAELLVDLRLDVTAKDVKALMKLLREACNATMPRQQSGLGGNRSAFWWNPQLAELTPPRWCHPAMEWPEPSLTAASSVRPVSEDELLAIAASLNPRKAPSIDGIPNGALTVAIRTSPGTFCRIYQDLLDRAKFPAQWKRQRLVLLAKPDKPPGLPSSYRPLCMLDTAAKVFERIVLNRLNEHLEQVDTPPLSPAQCGFRRGRSTVQAIQEVVARGFIGTLIGHPNLLWKRQKLVLLPKPDKPPGQSSSYPALCMLDTVGKVLERLILDRLNEHLEEASLRQLSDRQFGFRRGRSTVDAVRRIVEARRTAM